MTKWPVQKIIHRTTQKHVQHHDATFRILLLLKQYVRTNSNAYAPVCLVLNINN